MSQIQLSLGTQYLLPLAHPSYLLQSQDKKTSQLYSALAYLQDNQSNPSQMQVAKKTTILNNRSKIAKQRQIQRIREEAFAISGVTLRQNSNNANFNRNRTYSIVKTSKQIKKTITASEFSKINANNLQTKQIVYEYNLNQMKTQPFAADFNSKWKCTDEASLLSKNDQNSAASTIQKTYHLIQEQSRQYYSKVKPYKFTKLKNSTKKCQPSIEPNNIFNFLDKCLNKQGYQTRKRSGVWQKIELVSKSIKYRK